MSSIDKNKWQCAEDSKSSSKCWSRWWQQSERPIGAGIIINYAEDKPSLDVPYALADTHGRIYVREEYVDMAARVQDNIDSEIMEEVNALVVTGHPGIGKSVFGIYFLILRLRNGQPTCTYHPGLEFPCTFYSENGVYQSRDISDLPFETVCLVDMEDAKEPPPCYLTANSNIWLIQFASADRSSWGRWCRRRTAPVLCMNPWDPKELIESFNIHAVSELTLNLTDGEISEWLEDLIQDFGPVPRTVFARVRLGSREYTQEEIRAISSLTPDNLYRILTGNYDSEISDQIIIMTRKEKAKSPGHSDWSHIDIISKRMLRLLEDKRLELGFFQTRSLIRFSTGIAAEWFFESYAHKMITIDIPGNEVFALRRLRPMIGEKANSLRHTTNGSPSPPYYLPHSRYSRLLYRDIEMLLKELTSGTRRYFVPTKTSNPLFDALLIVEHQVEREKQTVRPGKKRKRTIQAVQPKFDVYVLQMTIEHEYGGSTAGYETLKSLKASGMVECLVYVLVVPFRSEDSDTYTWEMPEGWNTSGVKGDVYCLELDI